LINFERRIEDLKPINEKAVEDFEEAKNVTTPRKVTMTSSKRRKKN